jgi:hypothetical protein
MVYPQSAVEHYRTQQRISVTTAQQVDALWRGGMGDNFDLSWSSIAAQVFATVVAGQLMAARSGLDYVPTVAEEQGIDPAQVATVDANRFAGGTSAGMPVETLLAGAPIRAKKAMTLTQSTAASLVTAGVWLQRVVLDSVRDANRDATAAGMTVTPQVTGWVRQLNPPSCKFCLILAGKFFRWNEGFKRHPGCDCRHVPSTEPLADTLTVDPYRYFHSLTETEQDRLFDRNDAQAIRDGADIYRVVNVRDVGLAKVRNGRLGWQARRYGTPSKLTIDDIYTAAGADRDLAVRLMRENGFITGEQVAGGNILGNVPNDLAAGVLGRGGTRKGATVAYRKAVASGVRDPLEPATQTAAERRLHTAVLMKQAVDRGSNPFAANTARNPLTPRVRSLVDRNYQRQLEQVRKKESPEQLRVLARLLGIL